MTFAETSTRLLAAGSLAFGTWGLIAPRGLTDLMGDDPSIGRLLGTRDLALGVALLAWPGAATLAARVLADASDAVRLRDRSPRVALGAAVITVWGVAALVASRRSPPSAS
ncbi:MAG: hypothetical protein AB7N65_04445 [Vicinamibacterales bacterium]